MKPNPIRNLLAAAAVLLTVAGCAQVPLETKSINLVNDARDTMQRMKKRTDLKLFHELLKESYAVAVFPTLYKGGFFVGLDGPQVCLQAGTGPETGATPPSIPPPPAASGCNSAVRRRSWC